VCRHPEVDEIFTATATSAQTVTSDVETLLQLLKPSDMDKAKALLTQLSPQQREVLLALR
jgi:DNA-directed RNA polymerase specialized sigma24 family protein